MPCRRTLTGTVLAVAALAAPGAATARDRSLTVRLAACHRGVADADRYVDVDAVVRRVPRARHAALRFDLLWRPAGRALFSPYAGPGLGVFRRVPLPVLYQKRIQPLPVRAAYRVRVRVRWLGTGGRIIRRAERTTRGCRQPDLRPDLTVARFVRVGPKRFVAVIRNTGAGAAAAFTVGDRSGEAQGNLPVAGLAPGKSLRVPIAACDTAIADAGGQIAERDEANNSAFAPCPSK